MRAAGAVLLDLDGVLVDSRAAFAASVNHALERLGEPRRPPETLHPFLGPPTHETFRTLLGGDEARAAEGVRLYRERYGRRSAEETTVVDGIPAALDALVAAGLPLVVCTSKPKAFADPLLAALGLRGRMLAVEGPALEAVDEPKRTTMVRALAALPPDAGPVVMVGDREHDVAAALHHGLPCLGVLWGIGSADELRDAGAAELVATPPDLPAALGV